MNNVREIYKIRDTRMLDKNGNLYSNHITNLELRGVISRARVAAELAHRDYQIKRMKNTLLQIANLGSVCENFESCEHISCNDSAEANLLALSMLDKLEKDL